MALNVPPSGDRQRQPRRPQGTRLTSGRLRLAWAPIALCCLSLCTGGCGERPPGSTCLASSDCSTRLCYANRCLDRASDDDEDGLSNGAEHLVRSHPLKVDTDGDGKPDGAEVGPSASAPLDRDGDGVPDVLESSIADRDHDCLPDEIDPQDAVANQDPAVLARELCSHAGVCAGQHAAIVATCDVGAGTLKCDYSKVPGWSKGEACDGKDNDCDGQTDEGHSYQGHAVGAACQGVGACGVGVVQCAAGKAVCSSNPDGSAVKAAPEQCNGLDDDCDGKTDEGFVLDGLHVGTPCYGAGECGVGTVICGPTGYPMCSSNPGGPDARDKPEVCDGKDNDCDGLTDEGISLGLRALGTACMGLGACGPGVVVCGAAGVAVCSSDAGAPDSKATAEVCNGLDDNCDGKIDEGFSLDGAVLGQACKGQGVCADGVVVCGVSGKAACSTSPDAPGVTTTVEVCNGLDDDCDGQTDEDFVYQGQTLGGTCEGVGACGQGVVQCNAKGQVTCSTHADGSTPQVKPETCNGVDDDCNGLVDDGIAVSPEPTCEPLGICAGSQPAAACLAGKWVCDYPTVAGFEGPVESSCDGLDNDCDGQIDEGLDKPWAPGPVLASEGQPGPRQAAAWTSSGQALFLAGGRAGGLAGDLQWMPDLWRLDLAKQTWARVLVHPELAREGAALAWLPDKLVGPGERLWILGGNAATGAASEDWSVQPETGNAHQLAWKQPPGHRVGAVAVLALKANRLWLVGADPLGQQAGFQAFDLLSGLWLPTAQVPQLDALVGPVAACLGAQGALYAYGTDSAGQGRFGRLLPGAAKWETLKTHPEGASTLAVQHGQLVCEAAAGEVWLVGGALPGGDPAGIWRFSTGTLVWTAATGDQPTQVQPAVATVPGAGLLITHGRDAAGVPTDRGWQGTPGAFAPVWGGLNTVFGAELVVTGADVWRVGGASIAGTTLRDPGVSWRGNAAGWKAYPTPNGVSGRLFPSVIHDQPGGRLLIWGGLNPTAALASLASTVVQEPAPGAEALDLKTGKTTALPPGEMALLPTLAVETAVTAGPKSESAWVFGGSPTTGVAALWRIDLLKKGKTLLWSQPAPGPAFRRGATLTRDPTMNRLVLLSIDGALQVWSWDLGAGGGWQKLGEDATIAQGRVRLLGDPAATSLLALATFPVGGPPPALRTLQLSGKATLGPWPGKAPARWGPVASAWQATEQRTVLSRGADAKGTPAEGLDGWMVQCAQP